MKHGTTFATWICAVALGLTVLTARAVGQAWDVQINRDAVEVPRGDLFIQNLDSVWTAAGEVLEGVSIVIQDGVIRAIGRGLTPPRGAQIIDGVGFTAIPGLVDEHSHTAMDRSTNEGTAPVTPEIRVLDALDPGAFEIYQALAGGVTSALILHGSANPIGGQAAIIKMRWGMETSDQLLVEDAPRVVKFALGENVTRKNFGGSGARRFPGSRSGVEAIYEQAFTAARAYERTWDAYRERPGEFRVPPRRDLRLEALVDIMSGRIRVHAHSYRSDEIVMLLRIAEKFGFTIDAFTHVLEGYKVADEIAAHGAGASTFTDWWAYKLEAFDAIPFNAAIMHEKGVLTSLNSDLPSLQPTMVYEFIKPVKYGGVSREDALRMLTINPARQLKIDDKVGSIEVGKQADIVLLSGDPFNTYTRVEKTIIDGIVYFDLSRDRETRGEPVRESQPADVTPERTHADESGQARGDDMGGDASQSVAIALVGGTVHPVSSEPIPNGTVILENGIIRAVGPATTVAIPDGTRVLDVSGRHVYPGMIDPITQIGMVEISQVPASRDDTEVGTYNPHLRALSGVHPHSVEIPVTRVNGVTAVMSVAASGVIPGTGSVIQLRGDTPERMAIEDRAALVVAFPAPSGDDWDEPALEGESLEKLHELFTRATTYAAMPSGRSDPTGPFEPNVWGGDHTILSALAPAVTGEIPVFFLARRERDIRTLFLFLDEFPDVRPVLVGGDHAYRVADELASRQVPVIVGSALAPTMDREDPIAAGWENAARLEAAGVLVAFSGGESENFADENYANVRNLPYHAARSVAFGMSARGALRAVTLNAAEILGLADRMGSLDVGKRADVLVTDGDPLQILTKIERVFIGGEEVPLDTKHTELWTKFRDRK